MALSRHMGIATSYSFIFYDRLLIIIVSFIIVFAFVKVNVILHGFMLIITVFLSFPMLKNIINGLILAKTVDLKLGKYFFSGVYEGILYSLGWTGLHLSRNEEHVFVPFDYILEHGIVKAKRQSAIFIRLKCKPPDDTTIEKAREDIEKKIFLMPFILANSRPKIGIISNELFVEARLISSVYKQAFKDGLRTLKLDIQEIN